MTALGATLVVLGFFLALDNEDSRRPPVGGVCLTAGLFVLTVQVLRTAISALL